jgi:uncharacterized protein involved in exopolysaccharide biosynthesis
MTTDPSQPRGEAAHEVLHDWIARAVAAALDLGLAGVIGLASGAVVGIAIALVLPPRYTATASFIAQSAATPAVPSALQGLAASVGLGAARDFSPQFYADLIRSRPVLLSALGHQYPPLDGSAGGTYFEIAGIHGSSEAARDENGVRHLSRRVVARADVRTNVIDVAVTAASPEVSRQVLAVLLQALDSLNIGFRREQSRQLREFFETRVQVAQGELQQAESTYRSFLERNRVISNSPLLQFEDMRHRRVADLKQTVYTTVVRQYEEAKVQEARNVPILTILTAPTLPARKSWPPRRFIVVVCALAGFALAATGRPAKRMVTSIAAYRTPEHPGDR